MLSKCGDPLFIEYWEEPLLTKPRNKHHKSYTDFPGGYFIEVEQWTYNRGASSLIYYLTFSDGKLRKIQTGNKGFAINAIKSKPNKRCGLLVREGDRKIDVLRRCGQPTFKDAPNRSSHNRYLSLLGANDHWVYNFGPRHFLLHIRFFQGKVQNLEKGNYGF